MHTVSIHNMRVYAYHGCLPEEAIVGSNYRVDVDIQTDFTEAAEKDDLGLTIDYVKIAEIVTKEMAIRSKLIETVGHRIVKAIRNRYNSAQKVRLCIHKINPPAGADMESVSITIEA